MFEKVNTGGVTLTAFELITASFAAEEFNLREYWFGDVGDPLKIGVAREMAVQHPILRNIENTDFLQIVSLLHTMAKKQKSFQSSVENIDGIVVSCTRQTILNLSKSDFLEYEADGRTGLLRAAQFLWSERIFTKSELPYRSQIVPLAAILVLLGNRWQDDDVRSRLRQWFWSGVIGELYGSAVESRFAKDVQQVVPWALGTGATPSTIDDCNFVTDRLLTMRSRLSAAYKGLCALIAREAGALDWRTGATIEEQIKFQEPIDIHHIFPRSWCESEKIPAGIYDSIANKTPLSKKTNIQVGGDSPSKYIPRIEKRQSMDSERLNELLSTHLCSPDYMRKGAFKEAMIYRADQIVGLIEKTIKKKVGGRSIEEVFFGNPRADDIRINVRDLSAEEG